MEDEVSLVDRRKNQKFRITVEPIGLLICFAFAIQGVVIQNLYLSKVCLVNFNLSASECASHNHSTEVESQHSTDIQKYVSTLNIYASLIENIPSVILVLFLGPWSEKNGRKLPMMLPIVGHILAVSLYIANYYFHSWPAELILLASVPMGLCGGTPTLLMALNSYIVDITPTESRTSRISILYGCITLSFPVASFISIYLYTYGGYLAIWGASLGIALLALLYIILFIKDSRGPEETNKRINSTTTISQEDTTQSSCKMSEVIQNLYECFTVTFQERNGYKRICLVILLSSVCLYIFQVPSSVSYLYTKKVFDWDQPQYALFSTISSISVVFGNFVVLPILSSYFKVRDSIIGMIAISGNMGGLLSFAFAKVPEILYFASVCYILTSCIIVVIRSMISKLVLSDELSHVYSVLASLESTVPLICTPAYNLIYEATIDVFPGCVFIIAAGLNFIVLLLLSIVLILSSKERQDPVLYDNEDTSSSENS